jgi:polysaccharide export outer membrane protein
MTWGAIVVLGMMALSAMPTGSEYRVGPGDVLEIGTGGHPETSRLVTVQTTGTIALPRIGELTVGGLTVDEIRLKLSEPGVRVWVREYRSQFAWVAGEVIRPGRMPLRGGTRLVDALIAAGGLTEAASGEVVVERADGRFADGTAVKSFFLSGSQPTPEELRELETHLVARDVVTARKIEYVHVGGAVARPGRYPLRRGTLKEALAAAGGLARTAAGRVSVSRHDANTGATQTLELDVQADADARLQGDDRVEVLRRH